MATAIDFEIRNLTFQLSAHVPRFWHGGRRSITAYFDNLSIFFPPGESFFVRAVKTYRDAAQDDPALIEAVKAFCGQEGVHSREHRRYNKMLEDKGYPAEAMEARVQRILQIVKRTVPRRLQLAATCALEHFTALMGHSVLSDERVLEGADPVMRDLWLWHSIEETEHKAVAYDLWARIGGTYPERILAMVVASLIFWVKIIEHQVILMRHDSTLWSAREWGALLHFLFVKPGGMRKIIPGYLDYFRPGFHPWDHDNRALLREHLARFEHAETYQTS